jgi:hypothetical protein
MHRVASLVAVAGLVPLSVASPAMAAESVSKTGSCSTGSTWVLTAKEVDGDLADVRFTVDSPRAGSVWRMQLFREGVRVFTGLRKANDDGVVSVLRRLDEADDIDDRYVATARDTETGEKCVGQVRLLQS